MTNHAEQTLRLSHTGGVGGVLWCVSCRVVSCREWVVGRETGRTPTGPKLWLVVPASSSDSLTRANPKSDTYTSDTRQRIGGEPMQADGGGPEPWQYRSSGRPTCCAPLCRGG
jgi:hypothetical protein